MVVCDISFNNSQENLLFDDVLLHLAEKSDGGEVLRFWESPQPFIVLGRIGKAAEDINLSRTLADSIPVLRRSSGGGTVIQGSGCLNFSLVLSKELTPQAADLRGSYRFILDKVVAALATLSIESEFKPISDLALKGSQRKFSGNAQHRGRKFILHHGTILYDFDLSLIERYLTIPKSVPEYRQGRSHLEFVTNVPASAADLRQAIMKSFGGSSVIQKSTPAQASCLKIFLSGKPFPTPII